MAQTFPTSAQVIYEALAADTDLMDLVGSYEFKEGQTVVACWTSGDKKYYPGNKISKPSK